MDIQEVGKVIRNQEDCDPMLHIHWNLLMPY